VKELEAEPIAFAKKPEHDLFAHPLRLGTRPSRARRPGNRQVVPPQEKLAHYLGAGSIRSYKPLKRVQRQTRNRFFMWLGLSFSRYDNLVRDPVIIQTKLGAFRVQFSHADLLAWSFARLAFRRPHPNDNERQVALQPEAPTAAIRRRQTRSLECSG